MRIPSLDDHANGDGTYDGVSFFAEMTGLSQAEIKWIFDRTKELHAQGITGDACKLIIKAESKLKPWLHTERYREYVDRVNRMRDDGTIPD